MAFGKTDKRTVGSSASSVSGDNDEPPPKRKLERLKAFLSSFFYSLGHILNDLASAMWFSYLLLFFQNVMKMTPVMAATLLFIGQIVDAIFTPISGFLIHNYGSLGLWHVIGTVIVAISFPLVFFRCWFCDKGQQATTGMVAYYFILIVLFQTAWAVVQISHLAMIPFVSNSAKVRSDLTSYRYLASVVASMVVYLTTWQVLQSNSDTNSQNITPDDYTKFRDIVLILTCVGVISFLLFYIFFARRIREEEKMGEKVNKATTTTEETPIKLKDFLKMPVLYLTLLLFVSSRLFVTLSLIYLPLYLDERLIINPNTSGGSQVIATIPWALYISSFFVTVAVKFTINRIGNEISYLIGALLSLVTSVWIALFIDPYTHVAHIYLVAALIGAGSSITLVASLVITGSLIGVHADQAPAIYSIVTFADKMIAGIVVLVIEYLKCDQCKEYYKSVLIYACGVSTLLGIGSLLITILYLKKRDKHTMEDTMENSE